MIMISFSRCPLSKQSRDGSFCISCFPKNNLERKIYQKKTKDKFNIFVYAVISLSSRLITKRILRGLDMDGKEGMNKPNNTSQNI